MDGAPGGGFDVLLIHAGVTDRRSWRPLVDAVGDGRRVVSYDARGYGETTYRPEDHFSHDDALAVMTAAGLDAPVVVGASMGGRAALDLTLEHPDRVTALVLIAPAVSGTPEGDDEHAEPLATLARDLERAAEADDLAEVNRLEAHLWLDGPQAPEGRVGGAVRELFLEMNGRALAAVDPGDEPHSVDAWQRLEELTLPVLVLVGELDLPDVQEACRAVADRAANARLVVLPGVAHLPHFERDHACLAAIDDFLTGLDGP
ncbi:MAG: alpha/beta fold hydrolase [Nocardioidaceae bacterium]